MKLIRDLLFRVEALGNVAKRRDDRYWFTHGVLIPGHDDVLAVTDHL
ncbi:MAG TPA: hypothetical protein VEJ84_22525 [Acidimicrobiales bacterium]|nr:hypothetical protein [Acidimicrobiales bacterium]